MSASDPILTLDNPETVPAPYGNRFSNVARIDLGDRALLILSGQVGVDDAGEVIAPGDIRAQTERIFEVISALLAAHGSALAEVAHVRTFLTDMDDLAGYGEVRRRYFGAPPPASTTVEVSRLFLPGVVVEVEVTAVALKA
jgi:enamine deaminase RidA (YjgF/YER057c/UK114 family)